MGGEIDGGEVREWRMRKGRWELVKDFREVV